MKQVKQKDGRIRRWGRIRAGAGPANDFRAWSNSLRITRLLANVTITPMLRRLRSFALLLPILLLGLVLILWAISYLPDQICFRSHQGRLLIFFVSGSYVRWFERSTDQYRSTDAEVDYCRRVAEVQPLPMFRLAGFEWTGINFKSTFPGFVAIPYWFIATILAALSLWAILRRRSQRQRFLPGHCRACGYDLRGTNGKCPECGQDTSRFANSTSTAATG